MDLIQQIDDMAQVDEFRRFLDDVEALEPNSMADDMVTECITAKIDLLKEMGRGDFDAHHQMAQARGARGHEYDPNVQQALAGKRRLGLQSKQPGGVTPKADQLVRHQGKVYKIADTDGKIAFLSDPKRVFGGTDMKVDVSQLKPVKTKSGDIAWVSLG